MIRSEMDNNIPVTSQLAIQHGLSEEEFKRILGILGRTPTYEELGVFAVMWSEHCSYKNSILELKKLPRRGKRILAEAGSENAGLVDIGHGLAVAFKIESHNHPCAIDPYQGAATGVGGIMRDIFAMGARPIASLDSLHFGPLQQPRNCFLMDGVVRGIADYGNCLGVPTVSGEVFFHESYSANPIVNCMAVGIVEKERILSAVAQGKGSSVIIYGSSTGRDGIHGATFASEEIGAKSISRRSSVQVGDPFAEKLLLEATLEMVKAGLLLGLQDMGAAGITCCAAEMAARGRCGIEIDLDKVPLREQDMTAYEILLSESQERMLAIVQEGREGEVERILERWELAHARIGRVHDDGKMRVFFGGRQVCDIPAEALVLGGGAPAYVRQSRRPPVLDKLKATDLSPYRRNRDWNDVLLKLLASPNICDKSWVTAQFDSTVRTSTVVGPGGDAAVIWVKDTKLALAMCTDCNPNFAALNPRRGAALAVAEAARNVSCTGAEPIAITNCLNFGNPYKPESFYFFKEAVAGMAEACRVLKTPVASGNVSFFNESAESSILPTPVIGMLGILEDVDEVVRSAFQRPGDCVILLGRTASDLGGSEYLLYLYGLLAGEAPDLNLLLEKRTQYCLRAMIRRGWIRSAHDCSLGGLAVTLAECCILDKLHPLGVEIHIEPGALSSADMLFAETPSRIVISVPPQHREKVLSFAAARNVPARVIGQVVENQFHIGDCVNLKLEDLQSAYYQALPTYLSAAATFS